MRCCFWVCLLRHIYFGVLSVPFCPSTGCCACGRPFGVLRLDEQSPGFCSLRGTDENMEFKRSASSLNDTHILGGVKGLRSSGAPLVSVWGCGRLNGIDVLCLEELAQRSLEAPLISSHYVFSSTKLVADHTSKTCRHSLPVPDLHPFYKTSPCLH
ncbi:hypothetical protein GOP47_0018641 [Adiantum capillus-veneris]|uniref:Secreted protein n=1 Tax=Adiantum capillus-veneris TaxID=13818 RepID=A0A9D4UE37_ADICA|nr:hypothetical protein GOP47_0018641 [Adiantum capillus-veneris]